MKLMSVLIHAMLVLTVMGFSEGCVCPAPGTTWQERAAHMCGEVNHYHCLLVRSSDNVKERCTRPVHFPPGSYPVWGKHTNGYYVLDAVRCPFDRFQNKSYFSNIPGLTYCPYKKSKCRGRGQLTIYKSPSADNTCQCDQDAGYKFHEPRVGNDCSPSSENCICVRHNIAEYDVRNREHNSFSLAMKSLICKPLIMMVLVWLFFTL